MPRLVTRASVAAFFVCLAVAAAPANMSYDQAVAALQQLLNGQAFSSDTHTPAQLALSVVADDKGSIAITQTAVRDMPDLFFHSTTQQTWNLRAADIDAKRIVVRTSPISVYVPIKKDKRLVQVVREETKSRAEGGGLPGEEWSDHDAFSANFVSIPAHSIDSATRAAELLRQIAKSAPKQD